MTAMLFVSGCATPTTNSFNSDFNQSYTSSPRYYVTAVNEHKFKITLNQGEMVSGEARVHDIRQAAQIIAKNEAMKRGWENWDVNYIREGNQGWMHVAVAEVKRKPGVRYDHSNQN